MSGEVEAPGAEVDSAEPIPGDMIALGVRVNGEVVKYSWPLDEEGVTVETTPRYRLERDRRPIYTDVVIRFRFREP